jgi:hypothetical protein
MLSSSDNGGVNSWSQVVASLHHQLSSLAQLHVLHSNINDDALRRLILGSGSDSGDLNTITSNSDDGSDRVVCRLESLVCHNARWLQSLGGIKVIIDPPLLPH